MAWLMDERVLAGMVGAAGLSLWVWLGRKNPGPESVLAAATEAPATNPSRRAAAADRPADQLPILKADALFAALGAEGHVAAIRQSLGFAEQNWLNDVLPLLTGTAEFVQQFPASESHHHANPGGLLVHLLEVAVQAVKISEGRELPPGSTPEERARVRHRWRYGVLAGALLHDIGKPMADLRIELYGNDTRKGVPWNAITGSLPESDCSHYRIRFAPKDERNYGLHQRLPVLLFQRLIPTATRQWLQDDPKLVTSLLQLLSGEVGKANVIAEIVSKADQLSVADNLRNGSRARFTSAKAIPLIERLMGGLRTMLAAGGELPLNKPGAAGWVHDGHIYFVSKRVADATRAWLEKNERGDDLAGLPTDNERLFDTWQEYGATRVNPVTGQSIWRIQVKQGQFAAALTVLCFPLNKLYADPTLYPVNFEGSIELMSQPISPAVSDADSAEPASNTAPATDQAMPAPAPQSEQAIAVQTPHTSEADDEDDPFALPINTSSSAAAVSTDLENGASEALPSNNDMSMATIELAADNGLNSPDAQLSAYADSTSGTNKAAEASLLAAFGALPAVATKARHVPTKTAGSDIKAAIVASVEEGVLEPVVEPSASVPIMPVAPMAPQTPEIVQLAIDQNLSENKRAGLRLLAWIQDGIRTGTLPYNQANSPIHFVLEGMLLVSPEIFKRYTLSLPPSERPEEPEGKGVGHMAQRYATKCGLFQPNIIKTPSGKNDRRWVHTYRAHGGAQLHGFLLPKPELLFNPVPTPNLHLTNVAIEQSQPETVK